MVTLINLSLPIIRVQVNLSKIMSQKWSARLVRICPLDGLQVFLSSRGVVTSYLHGQVVEGQG